MTQVAVRDEPREVGLANFALAKTAHALETASELGKMVESQFREGLHFMRIPGVPKEQRPHIKDQGVSLIMAGFGVRTGDYRVLESRWEDQNDHYSLALQVEIVDILRGFIISTGVGSATSHEVKYAYRWMELADVPSGLDRTVLPTRTRRDGAKQYRVDNPDVGDLYNTLWKMAAKRAEGDAVLKLPGCSELFAGYRVSKPERDDKEEPDRTYWCEDHKTYWTQMANGRYGHNIAGTKQMCGRPLPQRATTPEEIAKAEDDLWGPKEPPAPASKTPRTASNQAQERVATSGMNPNPVQVPKRDDVPRLLKDIQANIQKYAKALHLDFPPHWAAWCVGNMPGKIPSGSKLTDLTREIQEELEAKLYEATQRQKEGGQHDPT